MATLAWYQRPPDGAQLQALTILRPLPNSAPVEGIILNHDVLGVMLHWKGRSLPHVAPDPDCDQCDALASPPKHCERHRCAGCDDLRPMRWEGYVPIWQKATGQIAIAVITPGAYQVIQTYLEQYASLRGARIKLQRKGHRTTAPVSAVIARSEVPPEQLPHAPDLERILKHIWGLDAPAKPTPVPEEQPWNPVNDKPAEPVNRLPLNGKNGHHKAKAK